MRSPRSPASLTTPLRNLELNRRRDAGSSPCESLTSKVRLLACILLPVVTAACGPPPALTVHATAGLYSDGSGRLGLALLATARGPQGAGPDTPLEGTLRSGGEVLPTTFDYPAAAGAAAWWFPGVAAAPGSTFELELAGAHASAGTTVTVLSSAELGSPEVDLTVDQTSLNWPAVEGAVAYRCVLTRSGAVQLDSMSPSPSCDVSALPDGAYSAQIHRERHLGVAKGLRYGADPNFGNRVKHVLNHATDIPGRPGAHGVFDAGRTGVLDVVDEAWDLAQAGGSGVAITTQGARTVYTVDMGRRIGFIGGQAGVAAGNPGVSHVRLVIESSADVITAFPVAP